MALTKFDNWRNPEENINEVDLRSIANQGRSMLGGAIGKLGSRFAGMISGKIKDLNNPVQRQKLLDVGASMIADQIGELPEDQVSDEAINALVRDLGTKLKPMVMKKIKKLGM